ncbi:Oxysterol-binding 1 [Neolecta irregularis DAH-3]|uniref:Oxysterol-binding 1 n=1 Tax=Neolecta irregularis (strain DAH-3) TaxID=1198029 RepID=A0A1U7LMJ4_NEOID|nr:Oxysterol-binding 1 [Neolecta irregularis DAH-3]|eukprot:OLL23867.1 Oxysterol-binding 1 [Neolecta irregularis DAH-3]
MSGAEQSQLAEQRRKSAHLLSHNTVNLSRKAGLAESIKNFKCLEALRSGDKAAIDKAIAQYDDENREAVSRASTSTLSSSDLSSPLHMAVQCAEPSIVEYLLSRPATEINARDQNGNTALHLAALFGREDIVEMLMKNDHMDDTITNHAGKQAFEIAKYVELSQSMQCMRHYILLLLRVVNRFQFCEKVQAGFEKLLNDENLELLKQFMENPRNTASVDLNRHNVDTGRTLLHEAAQKKSLAVLQWLVDEGADPFKRDKKGKLPWEVTKDEKVKNILRRKSTTPDDQPHNIGDQMRLAGYLKKWTNYTGGYKLRYFILDHGVLSYYKHQACRGSINMGIAKLSLDKDDKHGFEIIGKGSVRYHLRANHQVEANRWIWALTNAIEFTKDETKNKNRHSAIYDTESTSARSNAIYNHGRQPSLQSILAQRTLKEGPITQSTAIPRYPGARGSRISSQSEDEESIIEDPEMLEEPHKLNFELTANTARLQLETLEELSAGILREGLKIRAEGLDESLENGVATFRNALSSLRNTFRDLTRMGAERENYWASRLSKETEMRRLWEENMHALATEQERMERDMETAEKERRATKRILRQVTLQLEHASTPDTPSEFPKLLSQESQPRMSMSSVLSRLEHSEDDDEFFDAIGSGEVPVERMPPVVTDNVDEPNSRQVDIKTSFHGYSRPRERIPLDNDNRPKFSLWAIMKSMIGKDLTKITVPVFLNEPTSLLQRVAEDMEYVELLNTASQAADSTERMVYIAAFAASEYSSTVNRVAKPFNPLLGETFEYARPDLGYRYMSEQVSHHPPISACHAEGGRWEYWGENNVKSRFYGKSFDLVHLGVWFCKLYPCNGDPPELYTWRKVTTSVIGIITGSPTIDNYGEKEIKNYSTGDICKIEFKQRGWRSSGAYEVKGQVCDRSGTPQWSLGGHWNDKIYARKAHLDQNTAFLVWQNHYRPSAPFNLTPFAITLNDLPEDLKSWLAPTDTRLRPDQRAMEEGKYDLATSEKNRLEEKQRTKRREREAKGLKQEPKWFRKSVHPDTNDEYWEFPGEYWRKREELRDQKARNKEGGWEVDDIF